MENLIQFNESEIDWKPAPGQMENPWIMCPCPF